MTATLPVNRKAHIKGSVVWYRWKAGSNASSLFGPNRPNNPRTPRIGIILKVKDFNMYTVLLGTEKCNITGRWLWENYEDANQG